MSVYYGKFLVKEKLEQQKYNDLNQIDNSRKVNISLSVTIGQIFVVFCLDTMHLQIVCNFMST